ncbi:MAG: TlpA disulfide reductase family protein [Anaerolineales bacterium]
MKKAPNANKKRLLPYLLGGMALLLIAALGITWGRTQTDQAADPVETEAETIYPPARINRSAPELTLDTLDGEQISFRDLQGKVVLVNNWATWCPPCKAEMPELNAYYQDRKDQGFLVVAIEAGSPRSDVEAFVEREGIDFTVLLDPGSKALKSFQNASLPNSYVIDRQGSLRLTWTGAINQATLERYINPLLEE